MKKILLTILCLSSIIFLCAAAENKIKFSKEEKLIDLHKAIEFAKPGGESMEESEGSADSGTPNEDEESVIVISIRDVIITYNGIPLENKDLEQLLRWDCKENVRFCLVDDFAEAHVYRSVLKQLNELHSEIGLKFSYE